jgi:GNAT superfamily N-acetyltransferase
MGQQVARAGQVDIRRTPWRWLGTRVERLRAPIDCEQVGCEHEHSSRPGAGFFAPIRELAPAMLARLTGPAGRRGPVLVAEADDSGTSCIVALAEYAVGEDDGTCELALVVADAWQRLRLGHALMGMLIQAARDARCVRAVADVPYGNEAMLALGRAYDFAVARSPHGSTMLRLVRDLQGLLPTDRVRISAGGARQTGLTAAFAAS